MTSILILWRGGRVASLTVGGRSRPTQISNNSPLSSHWEVADNGSSRQALGGANRQLEE